jgi:hypothetical protein
MKMFGFAGIVASGLAAAVLGLAGPAQADLGHNNWVHDIQQHASVGSFTPTFGAHAKKGRPFLSATAFGERAY